MALWFRKKKDNTQDNPQLHQEPDVYGGSGINLSSNVQRSEPGFNQQGGAYPQSQPAQWQGREAQNPRYAGQQDRSMQPVYGQQNYPNQPYQNQPGVQQMPYQNPPQPVYPQGTATQQTRARQMPQASVTRGMQFSETTEQIENAEAEYRHDRRIRARRRFVGAAMLLVLVVVAFAFMFDKEPPPPTVTIPLTIPNKDSVDTAKIEVVGAPAPETKSAPPPPKPAPKPAPQEPPKQAAAPAPADAGAKQPAKEDAGAQQPAKQEAPQPAPEPPKEVKLASGQYFMQLIAISDEAKANDIRKSMIAAGLPSFLEKVAVKNGYVWRVRVGPFSSADAAEEARAKIVLMGNYTSVKVQQAK